MSDIVAFLGLAFAGGFFHTLLGPDHYIPLFSLSLSQRWNTLRVFSLIARLTVFHFFAMVALLAAALALAVEPAQLQRWDAYRDWGKVLLLGIVGIGLLLAGLRARLTHSHWHRHGEHYHCHPHRHHRRHRHAHSHFSRWPVTFLFFLTLIGPAEKFTSLMISSFSFFWLWLLAGVAAFALATFLGTCLIVGLGFVLVRRLPAGLRANTRAYAHMSCGTALVACSLFILLGA